jgi:GNAT superfamily N-acetyltransferase
MVQRFQIRAGAVRDIPTIHAMLRGLAKYERLLDRFHATRSSIRRDGFRGRRHFRTLICWRDRTPVGLAVYLFTYSTFNARPTLYVEDIFVWPRHRGQGAGQTLLAALARIAVRKGCARMEWTVLNWNTPAIRFYQRLGARLRKEWILTSLADAPLLRLARAHPADRNARRKTGSRRPQASRAAGQRV